MKTLSYIFAAVGLIALSYWTIVTVSARLYQARETQRVYDERRPPESPKAAPRLRPANGSTIGVLAIPRIGLSTAVIEGADERELKLGPGHVPGTSLPGEGGNVGIAGHRDTFFRPLRSIRKDDTINLTTPDGDYQYRVAATRIVVPEDIEVLYPTGRDTLTLVTCYPFDFVGPAPKRFIVQADCANCRP